MYEWQYLPRIPIPIPNRAWIEVIATDPDGEPVKDRDRGPNKRDGIAGGHERNLTP